MALEQLVGYTLCELPFAVLAKALQRYAGLSQGRARSAAGLIQWGLVLGACFAAWFWFLSGTNGPA